MKTIVRCADKMVFQVNPQTLEALQCSRYDPYCYSDPEPGVQYMEHSEWCQRKQALFYAARTARQSLGR